MSLAEVDHTFADCEELNLGCGEDHRPAAWNVDLSEAVNPDEVVDLQETPWPWPDDEFTTVTARHILEHLDPVPWDELFRVMADGGTLVWVYPIGHTRFEDPTHKQYWNWHTAEALSGERVHEHQFVDGLALIDRLVDYNVSGVSLWTLYTRLRMARHGPGPWMSQIPGLYGEVQAIYRYHG